jgi:hypothetical protein
MDLMNFSYDAATGFSVSLHWIVIVISVLVAAIWLLVRWKYLGERYAEFEIDEAEIGIGNHKVKIKPSEQDLQIAYQLWVELNTRKIGLKIDKENDVITELYNSWYEFFHISRELIKSIPVRKVRANKSTRELIDLSFKILNEAIRPHLTKWQAKFRKWYEAEKEKEENNNLTPQELQKRYPEYEELEKDLLHVNEVLISYKEVLEKLINVK